MPTSKEFFVINQPKYRVPGILDLHRRGMFRSRPFVTTNWIYRIVADKDLNVKLEYLSLVKKECTDPETNRSYNFAIERHLIDLDQTLMVNAVDLAKAVPDEAIRKSIIEKLEEFRSGYIPLNDQKELDREALEKKISASIQEHQNALRKQLVQKNKDWVDAAVPRLTQDFKRYFYTEVGDRLYARYQQFDGKEEPTELIRKIAFFNRVYDSPGDNTMLKPNGGYWKDEDEAWQCWVGFAGGEEEAKRICRVMDHVLRPLAEELTG